MWLASTTLVLAAAAMPAMAQPLRSDEGTSPRVLLTCRDVLAPGAVAKYRRFERDAARLCARRGCPNPLLAVETVAGPRSA